MIIRFLDTKDVVQHDMITSQAFSYSCDIHDKESVLPSEKVLGAFDDDNKTLFADMEIIDRECFFGSSVLSCAAVGGVAAKPEFRGRGAVKALFAYLDKMDYDISILYPFSEGYYRKLGFETAAQSLELTVPFSELSGIGRNSEVNLFEGKNADELLEIYNRCAAKYNLCFRRDNLNEFSAEPYLSQVFTYIWRKNSFARFDVDRENSLINVKEIYYDSCESLLGILGFFRNYEGNQKQIRFEKLPVDSPVLNFISDFHKCNAKLGNMGSVKIINVPSVLMEAEYPHYCRGFSIKIDDSAYSVSIDSGKADVKETYGKCDVEMDIASASKLILCGFSNKDIEFMPNVKINNPDSDFFIAFPPKGAFFTDGF